MFKKLSDPSVIKVIKAIAEIIVKICNHFLEQEANIIDVTEHKTEKEA